VDGGIRFDGPNASRQGVAMTINVMVVDDQAMVRAGLRMLLSGVTDLEVVAEAANGLEAVARAARFRPQCTLMDIRMAGARRAGGDAPNPRG
jgi:DNA-binding NarL/FixJ family response regulator